MEACTNQITKMYGPSLRLCVESTKILLFKELYINLKGLKALVHDIYFSKNDPPNKLVMNTKNNIDYKVHRNFREMKA